MKLLIKYNQEVGLICFGLTFIGLSVGLGSYEGRILAFLSGLFGAVAVFSIIEMITQLLVLRYVSIILKDCNPLRYCQCVQNFELERVSRFRAVNKARLTLLYWKMFSLLELKEYAEFEVLLPAFWDYMLHARNPIIQAEMSSLLCEYYRLLNCREGWDSCFQWFCKYREEITSNHVQHCPVPVFEHSECDNPQICYERKRGLIDALSLNKHVAPYNCVMNLSELAKYEKTLGNKLNEYRCLLFVIKQGGTLSVVGPAAKRVEELKSEDPTLIEAEEIPLDDIGRVLREDFLEEKVFLNQIHAEKN